MRKREIYKVTLSLLLIFLGGNGFCQISTKPAQKGFMTNTSSRVLYGSAAEACAAEVNTVLENYNYTIVDVFNCSSGTATSTFVSRMDYTGVVTDEYNGLHCGYHYTTTRTVAGSADCGVPLGTTVTNNDGYTLSIAELRVCESADGWSQWGSDSCYRSAQPYPPAADCPKCGNPTSVGSGSKQENHALIKLPSGPRSIPIELRYSNQFHLAGGVLLGEPSWFLDPADRRLNVGFVTSTSAPRVFTSRGRGTTEVFRRNADGSYRSFDPLVTLQSLAGQWKRVDFREGSVETYDSLGRLLFLRYFGGGGFDLAYPDASSQQPSGITSVTGQQIQLLYTAGRLTGLQLPDASNITLTYLAYTDAINHISDTYLKAVNFPDGRSKSFDYVAAITLPPPTPSGMGVSSAGKQYWSVAAGAPGEGSPMRISVNEQGRAFFNLSGVTDEGGTPFASFEYDNLGRVLISKHAGDTFKYTFNYHQGRTEVTDALQSKFNFYFQTVNEQIRVTSMARTIPANPAYYRSITTAYDSMGNIVQKGDNPSSTVQCMKVDPASNREVIRLEGGFSCPADLSTYQATGTERKIGTQWHPDWRLATKVAEPGRITTNVYNGQPDPFTGNAIASCAPSTALLPDGKPIAVVCKQVEQATTDARGSQGFAASLQPGVANRVTAWTYNQWGQVLTENGPRTDVNDTTTYAYYSDATADHMPGDLQSVTNAAGRVTQYGKYNRHGQLLESTDPNGVVTVNTYDLRQRLLSTTVGGQTTSYTYDPAGQLKRVTLPDMSWVGYDYDDAHRQVAVYDHKGNRTEYLLDNAGNRIGENTRDPGGALKRQLSRSIDALGRVKQTNGRE